MRAFVFSAIVVGCSSQRTPSVERHAPPLAVVAPAPVAPAPVAPAVTPDAGVAEPSFDAITEVLYAAPHTSSCAASLPEGARIRCLFDERYSADPKAASLAHELFVRWKIVAGVEVPHTMDGGYRGMIRLEPALPVGAERKHIEWIVDAMHDFDRFFEDLERRAGETKGKRYRFKPLTLRFVRSVAARTPSAYAHDWTVGWNLAGSLNTSADAVRETLFHEIFHLNDYARSQPDAEAWSFAALSAPFSAIVKKCGTTTSCLAPYSPNETLVRGGTYYAFQPGNGVREYAAELALRYYREQRAAFRGAPPKKSFKCGPPENALAWASMRDAFFDGVDAVPGC